MATGQTLQQAVKALLKADVPLAGCMVYVAFKSYQNQAKGTAWPKYSTLEQQWGIPVRTVAKWVKVLEAGGHMKSKRGQHGKVYTFPKVTAKQPKKKQPKAGKKHSSDMPDMAHLDEEPDMPGMAHLTSPSDMPGVAHLNGVMMAHSDMPGVACPDMPDVACHYKEELIELNNKKKRIPVDIPKASADDLLDAMVKKGKVAARKVKHDARRKK